MWTSAILLWAGAVAAAPLSFDVERPPSVVEIGHLGTKLRFDGVDLIARDAVLVALDESADVPAMIRVQGRALGRSERTWLFPGNGDVVGTALELARLPGVRSVMPDVLLPRRSSSFDDPEYGGQWYLERLEMEPLLERSLGSADVRVAVIDSAIQSDHPDLAAGVVAPYDAFSDDDDPSPNPGEYCPPGQTGLCDEHGTAVSGVITARANNQEGIVGMCPECSLVPIKLLGEGAGALSRDIAAFEHAIDSDAAVINNSWGYATATPVPAMLAEVIRRAATEPRDGLGAVVVFAAGNDDREIGNDELQALPEVLCVSATNSYGLPTNYTNSGESVDISAPSATVTTTIGDGYTYNFGGTSAAAPVVAGLAAWVLAAAPELSAEEVRTLLVETARKGPQVDYGTDGHHPVYGYGELDPTAVDAALFPEPDDDTGGDEPEEPRACGCSSAVASVSWWLLLPLLWVRRRDSA